ncbi:Hypothetical predicted protein [Cloeon dipterum]|uniref:dihydrofolate reductase n=1 Tax=Cloeon dipterum TaxID=197152 RepID=A0A8S1E978_9INSE|nr:Hypothetical predicted protein [Cloeon dipterum]
MEPKLELMVAACSNMGIGFKGDLPWHLPSEKEFFTKMTNSTEDGKKKNAVIMGRKTWESIPAHRRPLSGRINVVLTRNKDLRFGDEVVVCNSFEEAVSVLSSSRYKEQIERFWVIGGAPIYEAALNSPHCHRVYFTKIMAEYECDTFFPSMDFGKFETIPDPHVSDEIQEEQGVRYRYQVFQAKH